MILLSASKVWLWVQSDGGKRSFLTRTKNHLSLHPHPEMSREVVEETLLILQESQYYSLLDLGRTEKGWFMFIRSIYWTKVINFTNDGSNGNGSLSRLPRSAGQAAVSACTQVKMKNAPTILKIPKSECPNIWIRLPRNKWPKSWSILEDPVVPLERNLYGHLLAGLLGEKQFLRKFYWNTVGKKLKLGMLLCQPIKKTVLIRVCGRYQTVKEDRKHNTDMENSHGRRWSGRTNILSWPCTFGLHSKRVSNKQRSCAELQIYFWIQDVSWRHRKIVLFRWI